MIKIPQNCRVRTFNIIYNKFFDFLTRIVELQAEGNLEFSAIEELTYSLDAWIVKARFHEDLRLIATEFYLKQNQQGKATTQLKKVSNSFPQRKQALTEKLKS